jgi:hypothetical protein
MKIHFIGSILMIAFLQLQTQSLLAQADAPKAVLTTFVQMFPDAEEVYWDNDEEHFIAYFFHEAHEVEATFRRNGEYLQKVITLEYDELPKAALSYIEKEFGRNFDYPGITKVVTPTGESFFASFETETEIVNLTFDNKGQLLNKKAESIDDDE